MNVRRLFAVFGLLAVGCGAAACIIGPKQDDPAEDRGIEDVGVGLDSGAFTNPDTSIAAQDSAPPPSDTSTPSFDSSTASPDASGDSSPSDSGASDSGASDASDASDAAETD